MPIYGNARIGITTEDLKNTIEKTLGGAGVALSSPRLVIPAVIFGLSALSDHFQNSFFSFEVRAPLCYCTRSHLIGRLPDIPSRIYSSANIS
jgi:predicted sugar kinase